jgi:hypothetical protein
MRFQARGWVPALGQRVTVLYCLPDEYLFAGTIVRRTRRIQVGLTTIYDCEVVSDAWALDFKRPYGVYGGRGLRPALAELLAASAPNFRCGFIPSTCADVPVTTCAGDRRLSDIINGWVSLTANANWRIRPVSRAIDVFTAANLPDGNGLAVLNDTNISDLTETSDLSQVATKVYSVATGTVTTAAARAGGTSLPVAECGVFAALVASTGSVLLPRGIATYTARSAASGAGTLTVTALPWDVPEGTPVAFVKILADASATTALATLTGLDGVAERWLLDPTTNAAGATTRASAVLAAYAEGTSVVRYRTTERRVQPGQVVVFDITAPITLADTYVITDVVTTPRGGRTTTSRPDLWHEVTAVHVDLSLWSQLKYGSTPPGFRHAFM